MTKVFYDRGRGEVRAVAGISLTLRDGVCALVGANGAGKSTLLRLLTGLLQPTSGRVVVAGHDTRTAAAAVRRQVAYLSPTTRLYPRLTAQELLGYVAEVSGLTPTQTRQRCDAVIEQFALAPFVTQRISSLSTGQYQRVNLARTLLCEPNVVIFDEPTTGLDVVAAQQFLTALQAARQPGRLLVLATHVLREVELAAERLVLLRHGQVVFDGAPQVLGQGEALATAIYEYVNNSAPQVGAHAREVVA